MDQDKLPITGLPKFTNEKQTKADKPVFKMPTSLPNASSRLQAKTNDNDLILLGENDAVKSNEDNKTDNLQDIEFKFLKDIQEPPEDSDKNVPNQKHAECKSKDNATSKSKSTENVPQNDISPAEQKFEKESIPIVPYIEPPWGGLAPPCPTTDKPLYTIEELKNGTVSRS